MRRFLLIAVLVLVACEREQRDLLPRPALAELQGSDGNPAERRAFDVAEGKRLFRAFNCNGCHANGGGGMGPPLMDEEWIYGSAPAEIIATITDGRPNGMPAFGGKITEGQLRQLAAYVRSLSGQVAKDVAPGRSDHLVAKNPENATEKLDPRPSEPK